MAPLDYLDTELFLNHYIASRMLGDMSRGKDFLNLLAYMGAASVDAGIDGAHSNTSVSMSRIYLECSGERTRSNDLVDCQHCLIKAACLGWLSIA
ncbi:MAG: hypothetical protein ACTXOO_05340 [Sodalis sp. (in: enterobacteria)]